MMHRLLLQLPPALLPVLVFLGALVWLDSYKLVRPMRLAATLAAGGGAAVVAWAMLTGLSGAFGLEAAVYSRYVGPPVEETLKAVVVIYLIRAHRVGFLVDAAICGFAAGTGFALVENLFYLAALPGGSPGVWLVRGIGTAMMHGGTTGIFAILGKTFAERRSSASGLSFLPGLTAAIVLHSAFNHFFLSPVVSSLAVLIVLPALMAVVFRKSERALAEWLDVGFDADTELLELIRSGGVSSSPIGRYLQELRTRLPGEVVADMLCYLRLHVELALRAKGLLMLKESDFQAEPDAETKETLQELAYLERSIGRTGRLAMEPFLPLRGSELWQIYMLRR